MARRSRSRRLVRGASARRASARTSAVSAPVCGSAAIALQLACARCTAHQRSRAHIAHSRGCSAPASFRSEPALPSRPPRSQRLQERDDGKAHDPRGTADDAPAPRECHLHLGPHRGRAARQLQHDGPVRCRSCSPRAATCGAAAGSAAPIHAGRCGQDRAYNASWRLLCPSPPRPVHANCPLTVRLSHRLTVAGTW